MNQKNLAMYVVTQYLCYHLFEIIYCHLDFQFLQSQKQMEYDDDGVPKRAADRMKLDEAHKEVRAIGCGDNSVFAC